MDLDDGGNTVTDAWTGAMKDRCQVMAGRWREAGDVVRNLPRVMEQTQGKGVYFSQDIFFLVSHHWIDSKYTRRHSPLVRH